MTIVSTILYFILIAGISMTNLHFIFKNLETEQKIGFSIYSGFVSFMTVIAFLLMMKSRSDENMKFATLLIYFGSLLFYISDTTLSEQNKNSNIDGNSKNIMSYVVGATYWIGQFWIAQGTFKIAQICQQDD